MKRLVGPVVAVVVLLVLVGAMASWVQGPTAAVPVAPSTPSASPVQAADASPTASTPPPSAAVSHRAGLPDPRLTPGAVNPAVTPATLEKTICRSGWTKTVRPPAAYTNALKVAQIAQYGYTDRKLSHYEEDHLVPLELGGAPRDPRNLWPEPRTATLPDGTEVGADAKDRLENWLNAQVCSGAERLADAQRAIAKDWVQAWIDAGRP